MYKRKKLTSNKLEELKSLINNSVLSNEKEIKKLDSQTSGLIKWNYKPKGGLVEGSRVVFDFYSPYRNKELLKFIKDNILNNTKEKIISIHVNNYPETSGSPSHRDINSSITYLVLLEEAEEGGRLLIEEVDINFEIGEVVNFMGHTTLHSVTKLKKGKRRTFALWCREKSSII